MPATVPATIEERPAADLPTTYTPSAVEGPIYARWLELDVFNPDRAAAGAPPYCIVLPPPNVTGSLHVGHALNHTVMDVLTRRKRMQGYAALWLPGTDHAGIATQSVVERELARQGVGRTDLGRQEFVERVWAWKEEYGGRILAQMRRLGEGVDWSRLAFTMDERLSRAVRAVFRRLFDDGLIYRAERLVNWSPLLGTAISDIEVEYRDVEGELITLDYGSGVHVATTRVETMLGDTAVAVHPDDERYRHLVGTTLILPIVGRGIPVVADAAVDPAFGTGAVKVTPAHDPNDFAIAQRHGLPAVTVLDERARVTDTGTRFDGMDRDEARREVTGELRRLGRVVAEKRPYVHAVGHSSRSGEVIEPRLSLQWWVKVGPLAERAGAAVRAGETRFSPPEMAARYFGWVDDMHDWCISRQLWWGHRIPVWYGPQGQVVCPAEGEEPTGEGWAQDPDVLDTWFSSALWPFSTLGWPERTADLDRFYPTTVLVTGYDIIFFWVARMMMMGTYLGGELPGPVPFRTVAITGLVRDASGRKMSKSTGNVVDPLEWIDAYGADATRFGLLRGANPGADVNASEDNVEGARRFCNKIWNATRLARLSGALPGAPLPPRDRLSGADRWVLSRLSAVVAEADRLSEAFEFARLADLLYGFAWNEVCDWYLELVKAPIAAGGQRAEDTRVVLGHVVDTLLRLLHPIVPFLTEALWTDLTGGETLVTAAWPVPDPAWRDDAAEGEMRLLQGVVTEVRRVRSDQKVRPRATLPAVLVATEPALAAYAGDLAALADLELRPAEQVPAGWVPVVAPGAVVGLDLSGAVDAGAERSRRTKELGVAEAEAARQRSRLDSTAAAKAPAPVVADWRRRLAEAEADVARLKGLLG